MAKENRYRNVIIYFWSTELFLMVKVKIIVNKITSDVSRATYKFINSWI